MAVWNRLTGAITGIGVGAAARDAVAPIMETAKQSSWGQRAVAILNADTAARASVRGIDPRDSDPNAEAVTYSDDAKRQGVGRSRFAVLKQLETNFPGTEQILTWYRRQPSAFTDNDTARPKAEEALRRQGYNTEWTDRIMALATIRPPLTDLIRMAVREVFSPTLRAQLKLDEDFPVDILDRAQAIGLRESDARNYWAAHWDLPSYTQMSEMLFRGELKPEEFRDGLRALDYSPYWRDKLLTIAKRIPTLSDMIRFAVREAYDDDAAREQGLDLDYPENFTLEAAKHGLDPPDAKRYWRAHWRYPSPSQAYQMLHRKIIEPPELRALLKILDYPKPWREKLEKIAYHVPGRVDLRRMYEFHVIDRDAVKLGYERLGYTPADAETLTKFAEKIRAEKEATDPAKTEPHIVRARTQLWSAIHASYLAGDADLDTVREKLAAAGVPADAVTTILQLWGHEREVVRKRMSATQVKKAYKKPVTNTATGQPWTRDDALAELLSRGWSAQDANAFLDQ